MIIGLGSSLLSSCTNTGLQEFQGNSSKCATNFEMLISRVCFSQGSDSLFSSTQDQPGYCFLTVKQPLHTSLPEFQIS
jgi:hypothetical protein